MPGDASDAAAPCEVEGRSSREIRLRCEIARDGYLVVAQSWSPRWSVKVDGEARRLLRLSHAFQGVAVARGDAVVDLRYVTSSWVPVGGIGSALAWLALGWLGLRARAARSRTPAAS